MSVIHVLIHDFILLGECEIQSMGILLSYPNHTLKVIGMIAALPNALEVTLADKDAINAARAAYEKLPNEAQKSLVDTTRLEAAEMILQSLLQQEEPIVDDEPTKEGLPVWAIVLISVGGTMVLCVGAYMGWLLLKKYTAKKKAEAGETDETVEETTEETTDETATEETAEAVTEETVEQAVEETVEEAQETVENTEE